MNNKDLILENLRKGDLKACFDVFSIYFHRLMHYAKRVITVQEAEELVVSVFIPFFQQHDSFETWDEMEAFLYEEVGEQVSFVLHITHRTEEKRELLDKYFSDEGMKHERINEQLHQHIEELSPSEREAFWKQMNDAGSQTCL